MAEKLRDTLASLRATFDSGKTRSLDWRLSQLASLRQGLLEWREMFAEAAAADMGRPAFETVNVEVAPMDGELLKLMRELPRFASPLSVSTPLTLAPGTTSRAAEPKGVVLVISPWNFAIALAIAPLAAALGAGCCVLVKPSEKSPRCSALVARFCETWLDPSAVAVEQGGADVARQLLRLKFDHICYTGGCATAKEVYQAAAANLTPCTLELGGKNAAYVHSDVDVPCTARRLLHGAMVNAGQFCCGVDVAYVHTEVLPELLMAIEATLAEWYGDEPQRSPSFGRIVSSEAAARLGGLISTAGGELIVGGVVDEADRYVSPTVILNPDAAAEITRVETFGPILCVVRVPSADAAVELQRGLPKPLCKYCFAREGAVAEGYMRRVVAGMGCINDTMMQAANPEVPFGGVGESGFGAYHGVRGLLEFSHVCGTLHQPLSSLLDPYFRYPPYTPHKARMLAAVLSFQPPTWARILARLAKPLLYALLLALSYRLGRRSRPAIGMH